MEHRQVYEHSSRGDEKFNGIIQMPYVCPLSTESFGTGNACCRRICKKRMCLLIRAHAHDLRAEVEKDFKGLTQAEYELLVHLIAKDWKKANLSERPQALCHFAEKVSEAPKQMKFEDLSSLKQTGYSDRAIHDAVPTHRIFQLYQSYC